MVLLPFEYDGINGEKYKIIGWVGYCLKTKSDDGREHILTRHDTLGLLNSLGLSEREIPGHSVPEQKFAAEGWDAAYEESA